ncbi:MAG TPA: helix-turn-helix domain-containing protein [Herbaspirillum sp.]|jgi:DNA-binding IclR family transcriptional regulator
MAQAATLEIIDPDIMPKEIAEDSETDQKGGVIALERGLRILMALKVENGLTLSEIARQTGLNKTTVLRLLLSLERLAFIHRIDDIYKLGASIFVLAGGQSEAGFIRDLVTPTLIKLAENTGETATFYMKHGKQQRMCVAIACGNHVVRANVSIGDVLPLTGAAGKVFVAYAKGMPEGFHGDIMQSLGERNPELAAVAAPIFDRDGKLLGALSLSGTYIRFTASSNLEQLSAVLQKACAALNRSIRA